MSQSVDFHLSLCNSVQSVDLCFTTTGIDEYILQHRQFDVFLLTIQHFSANANSSRNIFGLKM